MGYERHVKQNQLLLLHLILIKYGHFPVDIAVFKKFLTLHSPNCSYISGDTTVLPSTNIIQHIIDSQNSFFVN